MRGKPSPIPVMELMLAEFEHHGYEIEAIALDPALMACVNGFATVVRFGEYIKGRGVASVAELEIKIDLRGDLDAGGLRRWRLTKTFAVERSVLGAIHLDAVLTLRGDISARNVQRQGKAALAMMLDLIADANAALNEPCSARGARNSRGSIVQLMVKVAGEIAIGRSGLAGSGSGVQISTLEARAMGRMICDRLANSIVPESMIVAAAVAMKSRAPTNNRLVSPVIHVGEGALP